MYDVAQYELEVEARGDEDYMLEAYGNEIDPLHEELCAAAECEDDEWVVEVQAKIAARDEAQRDRTLDSLYAPESDAERRHG